MISDWREYAAELLPRRSTVELVELVAKALSDAEKLGAMKAADVGYMAALKVRDEKFYTNRMGLPRGPYNTDYAIRVKKAILDGASKSLAW